jgi:hypothetical protein
MAPTADVVGRSKTEEDHVKSKRNRSEEAAVKMPTVADIGPLSFDDLYKAREYQKGRLALAFRLFAKFGFDEGVAGHITLKVCGAIKLVRNACLFSRRILLTPRASG